MERYIDELINIGGIDKADDVILLRLKNNYSYTFEKEYYCRLTETLDTYNFIKPEVESNPLNWIGNLWRSYILGKPDKETGAVAIRIPGSTIGYIRTKPLDNSSKKFIITDIEFFENASNFFSNGYNYYMKIFLGIIIVYPE